jgi:hypothetical protein
MSNKECINEILETSEKLGFIEKFFGVTPTKKDLERFKKFRAALKWKLQTPSLSYRKIGRILKVAPEIISKWINLRELPFLAKLLKAYISLGEPRKNYKWLCMHIGFGQTLDGPWIQVPISIRKFSDIVNVVNQLKPLPGSIKKIRKFFSTPNVRRLKLENFAYILGFCVGDFGKKKSGKCIRINSRVFSLKLTKRVKKNLLLGNFIKECVRALGLEMKRYKDQIDKATKAGRFYWESQHSLLVEWIFKVCLGLKDNETTTFNPVRMEWLFKAPKYFIKRFIQGLGDSDGQVNMQADCCNIASYPNTMFLKRLLEKLGVRVRIDNTADGKIVAVTPKEAIKIPLFFENEKISYRYADLKAYVKAKRIKPGGRVPEYVKSLIRRYSRRGCRKVDIIKTLAHKHGIIVGYETLSRYFSS